MATTDIKTVQNLVARISAIQKSASIKAATSQNGNPKGDSVSDVTDATNKGVQAVPSHPDGDDLKKTGLPAQGTNENGTKDVLTNLSGQVGSGGTGEVPGACATIDGDAKDRGATSPTADLNKIATKVANLVANLRKANSSLGDKSASDKSKLDPKDPAETAKPKQPASDVAGLPAQVENKDHKTAGKFLPDPAAPDFISKLAHAVAAIVEVEGGRALVEDLMAKKAGIDSARNLVDEVVVGYNEAVKQASEEIYQQAAFEEETNEKAAAFHELTKNASEDDKTMIVKIAETLTPAIDALDLPIEKIAMAMGAEDAAVMDDAGAFEEGAPEEAALPGAGAEGLEIEQIAQLLAGMVASGEIDEATAEALLMQLVGGEEGGDPAMEGDPAMMDPALAEDPAMAGMEAGASTSGGKHDAVPAEVKAAFLAITEAQSILAELDAA